MWCGEPCPNVDPAFDALDDTFIEDIAKAGATGVDPGIWGDTQQHFSFRGWQIHGTYFRSKVPPRKVSPAEARASRAQSPIEADGSAEMLRRERTRQFTALEGVVVKDRFTGERAIVDNPYALMKLFEMLDRDEDDQGRIDAMRRLAYKPMEEAQCDEKEKEEG